MTIEQNLTDIGASQKESAISLKEIITWQKQHVLDDGRRFKQIEKNMKNVADKRDLKDIVIEAVQKTVNGKLDDIKLHLNRQDVSIKELSNKIEPLDKSKTFLYQIGKVILYVGILSGSLAAIVALWDKINR